MKSETNHGRLFHAPVAAAPQDQKPRALLNRHKAEMVERTANIANLQGLETEISVILEGPMQSSPLRGPEDVTAARSLCALLIQSKPPPTA